jgi:hypothetical protein
MKRMLTFGIIAAVALLVSAYAGTGAIEPGYLSHALPVAERSCENPVRPVCCFFPWLC